jgi:alkanesulfonate monooxygenase SsuD/methylene tetrahydromethanopterin reductase-like flavin-dependent oxidoreductase (luciferase family)
MRFGVLTLQYVPWPELVESWRHLEDLDVDTIWVADHLVGLPGEPWFEAWSCLTALAQVTSRTRIGPLVSPMTYRNPGLLGRTALTVSELSGGRLELGVGSGASPSDHALTRVPEWAPKERAARFGPWLDHLLETMADERLQPRPPTPIPLTVAGGGPTILRLAAQHADRWNAFGGFGLSAEDGLAKCRRDNERLDEPARRRGGRCSVRPSSAIRSSRRPRSGRRRRGTTSSAAGRTRASTS